MICYKNAHYLYLGMKKFFKKIFLITASILVIVLAAVLVTDKLILPWYVSGEEVIVPNLIGKSKAEAIRILEELDLNPILENPRYDERFPKDAVIVHNPKAGKNVKVGRRVYLYISGGESLLKVPSFFGKTLRDSKVTIERLGLTLGEVVETKSEMPADRVIEQEPVEGTNVSAGTKITLMISIGPQIGMIRIPNILGKSFRDAEELLKRNSLKLGKITYLESPSLLPNTIIDQYPGEDKLVAVGDSIDIVITK